MRKTYTQRCRAKVCGSHIYKGWRLGLGDRGEAKQKGEQRQQN